MYQSYFGSAWGMGVFLHDFLMNPTVFWVKLYVMHRYSTTLVYILENHRKSAKIIYSETIRETIRKMYSSTANNVFRLLLLVVEIYSKHYYFRLEYLICVILP